MARMSAGEEGGNKISCSSHVWSQAEELRVGPWWSGVVIGAVGLKHPSRYHCLTFYIRS